VATLDDAAEALVLKVQGLDSEIEESQHRLADLRGRLEATAHEVEQEWTALTQAVAAFLEKVHEEQQRLDQDAQQALQAMADVQQAAATTGAEANSEIAGGGAHLDALTQHANTLHTNVESLATEAGETPAHNLAQRAAQIEQDLVHALEEARDFVRNDVVHGIEEVAHEIRDRCQALRTTLAEEHAHALQGAFDHWESKLGELEEYVKTHGFLASHDHAHAYVDYALGECKWMSCAR
jgi:chromosome segregation ATPase